MFGLINLHRIAAGRGDGLRPEFLELLSQQHLPATVNVEWIADYRATGHVQAGAAPRQPLAGADQSNVVSFPRDEQAARPAARRGA